MLGSRAIAGDATEKRAGHAVTCPRPRDSPYITPPHVTHLRDNLMGRGSVGRRLEGHLSSPHKFQHGSAGAGAAGLGRGSSMPGLTQARPPGDRQSQAGCYLPSGPGFLLLGLLWSGSYHSL